MERTSRLLWLRTALSCYLLHARRMFSSKVQCRSNISLYGNLRLKSHLAIRCDGTVMHCFSLWPHLKCTSPFLRLKVLLVTLLTECHKNLTVCWTPWMCGAVPRQPHLTTVSAVSEALLSHESCHSSLMRTCCMFSFAIVRLHVVGWTGKRSWWRLGAERRPVPVHRWTACRVVVCCLQSCVFAFCGFQNNSADVIFACIEPCVIQDGLIESLCK